MTIFHPFQHCLAIISTSFIYAAQLHHATLTLYYSRLQTEQKCNLITDGNLASFGKYATLGSCGGVYMDALVGKWTCELECMTGFVNTAGGVISCGPNADEPWGKLSGSITCQGIFVVCRKLQHMSRVTGTNAMCSPLSPLVRFCLFCPHIF